MKEIIIKTENLTKIYKLPAEVISAVRDVSLEIYSGDFIAVMGHSGSGKTTLLDSIGCLTTITSGKLSVTGEDVSRANEAKLVSIRRRLISFVFQDFLLINSLTAIENVLMPLYFAGLPQDKKRATEILGKVGLSHRVNHLPTQLSGGEKQRVSIARALITGPKLLLADEPTGNLDNKNSQEIFDILKGLNKTEELTILMVTHNEKLGSQASRIIYLEDGRIIKNS